MVKFKGQNNKSIDRLLKRKLKLSSKIVMNPMKRMIFQMNLYLKTDQAIEPDKKANPRIFLTRNQID
jgi:hypothetical protein